MPKYMIEYNETRSGSELVEAPSALAAGRAVIRERPTGTNRTIINATEQEEAQ